MDTVWTFETARFTIALELTPCDYLDLTWDETGETADMIDRGIWEAFDSRVVVYLDGREVGSDSLGQSIYERPSDFWEGHRAADPMDRNCTIMRAARGGNVCIGHYFPDMVREAIADARRTLRNAPELRAA